jgi:hypothetical protein
MTGKADHINSRLEAIGSEDGAEPHCFAAKKAGSAIPSDGLQQEA